MKLGSLFDGIGGFPYSGQKFGIEPVWASEIEKWPIKVTQKHFSGMKHLGDITQINGAEIEPVDIITFGSPCTRLSVAGKHDGFDITFKCYDEGKKHNQPHYINTIKATDKYQYEYKTICPICGKELIETNESALFFHAIRIIQEMRCITNGTCPRFAVWENVPGAFSSNKGQDFRAVLEEIGEAKIPMPKSGRWATAGMVRTKTADIAWRTINAQYFGVPQRRRRIFLVADFGGQCAGEILFVEEIPQGDFTESRETREEVVATIGSGIENTNRLTPWDCQSKRIYKEDSVWPTLYSGEGGGSKNQAVLIRNTSTYWDGGQISDCLGCSTLTKGQMMPEKRRFPVVLYDMTHADEVIRPVQEGIAPTLNSRMGTGGNQVPVMMQPIPIHDKATRHNGGGNTRNNDGAANGLGIGKPGEPMPTLGTSDRHAVAYDVLAAGFKYGNSASARGIGYEAEISPTLCGGEGGNQKPCVCIAGYPEPSNALLTKANLSFRDDQDTLVATIDCRNFCENEEISATLQAKSNGGYSLNCQNPIRTGYAVRRLTPLECLRLQGFPDWWLDIEGMSDTQKYKAVGNSVAIPCVNFVLGRIARKIEEG